MIMSGWILPDYTFVTCKSYLGNKEHIRIVKRFLNTLKEKEPSIYIDIMTRASKLHLTTLDDIAVTILGWAKVNDVPFKAIYYADFSTHEYVLARYEQLGFKCIQVFSNTLVKIKNPSIYLS